ncbi:MAG: Zn-ribbon domain-containing OB-fold protein [Planctomycetota bacterium]
MPSPRYWREIPARFRLEAVRCKSCGKVLYPVRQICSGCRGEDLAPIRLTPKGKVITYTVIRTPPDDFLMEGPYAMAIVETPEGARLMTQVVDGDPEAVAIGTEVDLEFRLVRKEARGGILCYGHKAVPAG